MPRLNGKAACHRCLLSHVGADDFDRVDRALAAEMLSELLEGWETGPVASTDDISLWDQVESELEARFLAGIKQWASDPGRTLGVGGLVNDRRTADLRVTAPDGSVVHWQVILQNTIKGTRPDVVFRRLDAAPLEVDVYLDGFTYHAAPGVNRLADDAAKRARLRAHGRLVFALNWTDLKAWETGEEPQHPVWKPYGGIAEGAARKFYHQLGGDPAELDGLVWANPFRMLTAFLTEPDIGAWRHRAQAATVALLRLKETERGDTTRASVPERIRTALDGVLDGTPLPRPDGKDLVVARLRDASGCPLVLALPAGSTEVTAFALVDDRDEAVRESEHEARWQAWLYWGNLLQFLSYGNADGGQLAVTDLAGFDPTALVIAGGIGLNTLLSMVPLDDDGPARTEPATGAEPATGTEPATGAEPAIGTEAAVDVARPGTASDVEEPGEAPEPDAEWQRILDYLDPDEPGLVSLARRLARLPVPHPVDGYELGRAAWQAELAWPDAKVAVVLAGDREAEQRNAAYAAEGWIVRPATHWTVDELPALIAERRQ